MFSSLTKREKIAIKIKVDKEWVAREGEGGSKGGREREINIIEVVELRLQN